MSGMIYALVLEQFHVGRRLYKEICSNQNLKSKVYPLTKNYINIIINIIVSFTSILAFSDMKTSSVWSLSAFWDRLLGWLLPTLPSPSFFSNPMMWVERQMQEHEHLFHILSIILILCIILASCFALSVLFLAVFHVSISYALSAFQRTVETIRTTMPSLIPATSSTTPGTAIDTSSAAAPGPSSAAGAQNNTIEGIEPLTITEELEIIIKTLGNQREHTDAILTALGDQRVRIDAIVTTLGNQREHTDEMVRDLRNTLTVELQGMRQALIALETRQAEYHLNQRQIQEDEAGEIRSDDNYTEEEKEETEKDKEEATSSSTTEEETEEKDQEEASSSSTTEEEKEEKDKEEASSSSTTEEEKEEKDKEEATSSSTTKEEVEKKDKGKEASTSS
ncbi:hypothetical protein BDB00DRAFT_941374 [Zychaea mexicana]|uniref:uncharacterized protein n=1 Tax=Zychaea mexicana TaxID=64656 RepID=UPI0022FF027D|nr:uncharacterized protein BDB00DRAFT_941374 [Zychaea mexicana]KAI9489843.1 hypothetical protein BDB00DRAFT_941374 [Zychaea mexicana]